MDTQRAEVVHGTVIGFGVVLNPDEPNERRVLFTTEEEWEDIDRQYGPKGLYCGMTFFTRILRTDLVEEEKEGVCFSDLSLGREYEKLACRCGATCWFPKRAGSGYPRSFQCEACSERAAYWSQQQSLIDGD